MHGEAEARRMVDNGAQVGLRARERELSGRGGVEIDRVSLLDEQAEQRAVGRRAQPFEEDLGLPGAQVEGRRPQQVSRRFETGKVEAGVQAASRVPGISVSVLPRLAPRRAEPRRRCPTTLMSQVRSCQRPRGR